MLTPELKALVEAEAPKYVKEFFDKLKDGKDFIWNDVGIYAATKTAQFLFDHLSKPSEDDEKAAKEFIKYGWQVNEEDAHDAIELGIVTGYLAACTQKNAVIAARDAEIAELKNKVMQLESHLDDVGGE